LIWYAQLDASHLPRPGKEAAAAMSPGLIVLLLSLLLGLQPVTTDLYLPALPALTEGFGASMAQAQLTLTALAAFVWPVPVGLGAAVLRFEETVPPANRRGMHPVSLAKTCLLGSFYWGQTLISL
jgi:hypothetical protein